MNLMIGASHYNQHNLLKAIVRIMKTISQILVYLNGERIRSLLLWVDRCSAGGGGFRL